MAVKAELFKVKEVSTRISTERELKGGKRVKREREK
jgi:hypothetical protein